MSGTDETTNISDADCKRLQEAMPFYPPFRETIDAAGPAS